MAPTPGGETSPPERKGDDEEAVVHVPSLDESEEEEDAVRDDTIKWGITDK